MNLTNVRASTVAMLAALAALLPGLPDPATAVAQEPQRPPEVTIAFLGGAVEVADIASIEGLSPGLMSAGLGEVAPAQTYLDITQGNRISDSLYDEPLPLVYALRSGVPPRPWGAIVERAEEAPADLIPGLLASAIADGGSVGTEMRAGSHVGPPALVAADRSGRVERSARCERVACRGTTVVSVGIEELPGLIDGLMGGDMLIAIARPRPLEERRLLPIGIAGEGFDGNLTSDSTRLGGLVLATDVAPTVLERLEIPIPDEMNGQPIRAEGRLDADAIESLAARLDAIGPRRDPVILTNFVIWVALAVAASLALRPRGPRVALPMLLVASAYVPTALLLAAAIEPSEIAERLIVGLGCPALAALTLLALRPFAAIAVACALSVGWSAVDVLAGSPLTSLSLLGPNPSLGARFFGVGNELEATLVALLLLGIGAGLVAWDRRAHRRTAVTAFVVGGVAGVAVFAPGQFGADVGFAIALPFGVAVAVAVVLEAGRRVGALVIAAPVAALSLVVVADLVLGGDAHLSQSVLQAGGLDQVGDVAQRRITLSARSFERNVDSPYFLLAVALVVLAIVRRDDVLAWFDGRRAALGAFLGAAAATILGTLANDSGALLLMIGTGYVAMFAMVAWATRRDPRQVADRAVAVRDP